MYVEMMRYAVRVKTRIDAVEARIYREIVK